MIKIDFSKIQEDWLFTDDEIPEVLHYIKPVNKFTGINIDPVDMAGFFYCVLLW